MRCVEIFIKKQIPKLKLYDWWAIRGGAEFDTFQYAGVITNLDYNQYDRNVFEQPTFDLDIPELFKDFFSSGAGGGVPYENTLCLGGWGVLTHCFDRRQHLFLI